MGFQNIEQELLAWREEGREALIEGKREIHRPAMCGRCFKEYGLVGSPTWATAVAAYVTARKPVLARQGRDLSGGLVGHLDLPLAGQVPECSLPAAAAGRRRRLLHLRRTNIAMGLNSASKNGDARISRIADDAGIRHALHES